MVHSDLVFTQ